MAQHSYPLYLQLKQVLEDFIFSGKLLPGQEISSIRSLAERYQVNPNTIQRALSSLREEKLILLNHGRLFVTSDRQMVLQCRERKARLLASQLCTSLVSLGYGQEDILALGGL